MVQAVKEQLQTGSGDGALMAGITDSKATHTHTHKIKSKEMVGHLN